MDWPKHMTAPPAPQHPGRILFEQAMKPLNVSRNKLARDIDVPVGRISDIVSGKRGVTPDTALRLAKYFGTSAELWMRLQSEFDLHVSRTTTWAKVEPRVRAFEEVEGGATHSLPGERPLRAEPAAPPPAAAPPPQLEIPLAPPAPEIVAETVTPTPPPVAAATPQLEIPPAPPAPPSSLSVPLEREELQVPAPPQPRAAADTPQPRAAPDLPPLRAVRLDAAPPLETPRSLIPGRPAARFGDVAPAAPEVPEASAADAMDDSLDIPDPEDPFLLDRRFEIKSD